jgi:hypothetical protein
VWPKPDPAKQEEAKSALEAAKKKHESCRNYRDRGALVAAFWENPGNRTTRVSRFDTLFVRDKGLRFRFFGESGKLEHAIWRRGDKTVRYSLGRSEETSYERALWAFMGVTSRTSSRVPALLYRTQHGGPQESCKPHFLGVSFTCGSATSGGATCTRVLMECGRAETQDVWSSTTHRESSAATSP